MSRLVFFIILSIFFNFLPSILLAEAAEINPGSVRFNREGRVQFSDGRYQFSRLVRESEFKEDDRQFIYCDPGDKVISGGCALFYSNRKLTGTTPSLNFPVVEEGGRKGLWVLDENNDPVFNNEGWACTFTLDDGVNAYQKPEQEPLYNLFITCQK